jgi:hypothetical protein
MFEITISGGDVHISPAADTRRFVQMPRLYMTDAQFIDGFRKGLGNSLTDINANVPLTDEIVIDLVKSFFEEGTPTDSELAYLVGNFMGVLVAKL